MIDLHKIIKLYPFNKLSNNICSNLISKCKICSFRKGKYIYYEGDVADYFYFILEGTVSLYKWIDSDKDKLIKEFMFGKWLACSEIILNEPYFFDAKAKRDVTCLKISRNNLNYVLSIDEINKSVLHSIATWNNVYNEMLKSETCISTLKNYIKNLELTVIHITQDELSNILGYTRETINKNLKKLESQGYIKLERSKILKLS